MTLFREVVDLVENETLGELGKPIEIVQYIHVFLLAATRKNDFGERQ